MTRTLTSLMAFAILILSQMGGQDVFIDGRGPDSLRTPANSYTCEYRSGDLNVVGSGSDLNAARSDASIKCFDKRMQLLEKRGREVSEEQGIMTIDSCVNISCS